jgi:cytochrome c553
MIPQQSPGSGDQYKQTDFSGTTLRVHISRGEVKMLTKRLIFALMFIFMLAAGSAQAGGDAARGAELAVDCADCHGDDGLGDEDVPAIAGMDAAKHAKELADFKSGARADEDENMTDSVADLSEQDMADLAAHFATLPGK